MSCLSTCSVRLCRQPAAGNSPITDQPYCAKHLLVDLSRCEKLEAVVTERISYFKKYQKPLQLMQQRLASDLLLLGKNFNNLRETIDKYQTELTAAITKHHDKLKESLQILTDLDNFEIELRTAKDGKNNRQAFLMTENMEKSALQLDSELVSINDDATAVEITAFPDVNSVVKDLESCTEISLRLLRIQVQFLNKGSETVSFTEEEKQVELDGVPACMALCNDIRGSALAACGLRSQIPEQPQPTVFVAVENDTERKIVLVSDSGEVTGSLSCTFDQPIRGLHCDSDEQLLFIAQDDAVIVTDLCGVEQATIAAYELQQDVQRVRCITGDSDKLFVLAELADGKPAIFGLSKKSREIQLTHSLSGLENIADCAAISARDGMLFVNDGVQLHTVCSITGVLLASSDCNNSDNGSILDLDALTSAEDAVSVTYLLACHRLRSSYPILAIRGPYCGDASTVRLVREGKGKEFEISDGRLAFTAFEIL